MAVFKVDTTLLGLADRSKVLAALSGFSSRPAGAWLSGAASLRTGQLPSSWSQVHALPAPDVVQLLAAAGPNHCIDGWAYLSRGLSALMAGDGHACRHLAYYSQLRAGLSLLSALGVGVFNRINFVVTSQGKIERIDPEITGAWSSRGLGTHLAVWEALHLWSDTSKNSLTFLDMVRLHGSTLTDLLKTVWPGFSPTVAKAFVEDWGVDLQRGPDEQSARNVSSYQPMLLNPLQSSVTEDLAFVEQLWELLEPSGGSGFDNLDRYLLRSLLYRQRRIREKGVALKDSALVTRHELLPAQIRALISTDFLTGLSGGNEPDLLSSARSKAQVPSPREMLSRGLLLLRTATAFVSTNFLEAGVSFSAGELRPWLDEVGLARGYWTPAYPVGPLVDLWADVELALDEFRISRQANPSGMYDWLSFNNKGIPRVAEAERAGLWNLSS